MTRRQVLGGLGAGLLGMAGCGSLTPMPPLAPGGSTPAARRRLAEVAQAHGAAAFRRLYDVSLAFSAWPLDGLADVPAEGSAAAPVELRGLLRRGLIAGWQTPQGPSTLAWLQRLPGDYGLPPAPPTQAWTGRAPIDGGEGLAAIGEAIELAWVALFGPLAFIDAALDMEESPPLWIDGRQCAGLRLRRMERPAAAAVPADFLLYVDPVTGLARRIGRQAQDGSLAWVEATEPVDRHGLRWPTRFELRRTGVERVRRPLRRWQLTGLDVDRVYGPEHLQPPAPPSGPAAAPAAAIG